MFTGLAVISVVKILTIWCWREVQQHWSSSVGWQRICQLHGWCDWPIPGTFTEIGYIPLGVVCCVVRSCRQRYWWWYAMSNSSNGYSHTITRNLFLVIWGMCDSSGLSSLTILERHPYWHFARADMLAVEQEKVRSLNRGEKSVWQCCKKTVVVNVFEHREPSFGTLSWWIQDRSKALWE